MCCYDVRLFLKKDGCFAYIVAFSFILLLWGDINVAGFGLLLLVSCLFGLVFGLVHLGVGRLSVAWQGFVRASLFCCLMAVIFMLFTVLLKALLGFFIQEQSDTLLQRSLRVLNFLLFCCIWGLIFFFVSLGAKHLGLSWLWFSNEDVLTILRTFFFILLCQGAKFARVMGKAFFKRIVF